MKKAIQLLTLLLSGILLSYCCSPRKATNNTVNTAVSIPGPKVIIYKTTNDYSKLVPVILSDDKKTLVSYPDIRDVYFNGNLAYPTRLHDGYWLDNRGIDKNVAFINMTYEEYSKLKATPSPAELMAMIIDPQPLSIMYNCGSRALYNNIEQEINIKIDKGDFSSFVRLK